MALVALEVPPRPDAPVSKTPVDTGQGTSEAASSVSTYKSMAEDFARQDGLPAHIAHAVMEIESNFNPNSRGAAGEVGLMQIMPPTAAMLGFSGTLDDLADPKKNIELGVRYLAQAYRLTGGDLCATVMKYRAGHRETRFSVRSVNYCKKARAILKREGFGVTGIVPKATFGFSTPVSTASPKMRVESSRKVEAYQVCVTRSFVAGPGYRKCLKTATVRVARHAIEQRKKLFD
ncbi:lytic transglycosylase domain-containing protein [Oricola cellulosilytica]|uniref:Lytic transglycosylase domain-containing protein n=2 Tax=Oricola cellulosilytica TaxID=1429082 RepID=A0A4R0PBF3_9HYPH|nr:lytic transglycosylase domain-containing protein [Oricola cellulosilytica]